VNEVGELHGILHEEHRNIVSVEGCVRLGRIVVIENSKAVPDDIPVTLGGVKLGSKPTDVTHGIRATSRALDGREAYEHRCGPRGVGEDGGESVFGSSVVEDMEMSVSSGAASVDDAFGDTLMVESVNLLHGDLILEKSRTGALRDA
jgi:hypothetical protein